MKIKNKTLISVDNIRIINGTITTPTSQEIALDILIDRERQSAVDQFQACSQ
jgi:hypothetical protein